MDRHRADHCPGLLRPWAADDGLLVRLRIPGGRISTDALRALVAVAERWGDGRVHGTVRANLQLRGLPAGSDPDRLPADVEQAILATGLLPSPAHERVRNILASPASGLAGGRADVRPLVEALDRALLARPALAALPGRFLFVLDDGRGDLVARSADLALVFLCAEEAQVRTGDRWGPVTARAEAVGALLDRAEAFVACRGTGPTAAWHITELESPLEPAATPDPRLPAPVPPLPFGPVPGGVHLPFGDAGIGGETLAALSATDHVVVTPWKGVLVPRRTDA